MGIFKKLFKQDKLDEGLLGTWKSNFKDELTAQELGDVEITFEGDGQMRYTIKSDARDQIMLMTYKTIGNLIISNQASMPKEEETKYHFEGDKLILNFSGQVSKFIKTQT